MNPTSWPSFLVTDRPSHHPGTRGRAARRSQIPSPYVMGQGVTPASSGSAGRHRRLKFQVVSGAPTRPAAATRTPVAGLLAKTRRLRPLLRRPRPGHCRRDSGSDQGCRGSPDRWPGCFLPNSWPTTVAGTPLAARTAKPGGTSRYPSRAQSECIVALGMGHESCGRPAARLGEP